MTRIAIIGGGFSGASAAVQWARKVPQPLAITIFEPRAQLGHGLAYSTDNPTFRLNAHAGLHAIDVADPNHLIHWCETQRLSEHDPGAFAANGQAFLRRQDYGRYLADSVREHADWPATGSSITHRRLRVVDLHFAEGRAMLGLEDGSTQEADQVLLATGNPLPRRPEVLDAITPGHPHLRTNPLSEGLDGIPTDSRVLVIGAGLTALDMIAGLIERGHEGAIVAVSRHGLRPRSQPPPVFALPTAAANPPVQPLDVLEGPVPAYAEDNVLTVNTLLRGLRRDIRNIEATGRSWHAAFDALALVVSRIWPKLPLDEQRRFLRRLRPWYDVHRFRTPPMTEAVVLRAERAGQVAYRAALLKAIEGSEGGTFTAHFGHTKGRQARETFGAVINCAGLDSGDTVAGNPLLGALVDRGLILPHPNGVGFLTDPSCRALNALGQPRHNLRIIGPPTAGVFGDPLGALFISAQVHRTLPAFMEDLPPGS